MNEAERYSHDNTSLLDDPNKRYVAIVLASLFVVPIGGAMLLPGWGIVEWIVVASPVIIAFCVFRADLLLPFMIERMGTKATVVLIVVAALLLGWLLFHPSD
jgi:hypothetical protein